MNIIVAVCENNGIGKDNSLPWHFKENFLKNKKFNNKIKIFPLPKIHVIK